MLHNEILSRLNDILQPMRCRNYVEQTTVIVLITILISRYNFFSRIKKKENVPSTAGFRSFILISFLEGKSASILDGMEVTSHVAAHRVIISQSK